MNAVTEVDLVRGPAVLAELPATQGVAATAPTPFQSLGWLRAWITAAAAAERAQPLLAKVRLPAGGQAVLWLQLQDGGDGPVLRPLTCPWADYHDACLITGDADAAVAAIAVALDAVRRAEQARLDLPDLVAGGLLHRAMIDLGAKTGPGSAVVVVDLTEPTVVDAVVGRPELVRKRRRLAAAGPVSLVHHRAPVQISERLPAFIAMHAAQWRDRADVVAPFDGGVVDRVFTELAGQPDGAAMLSELRVGTTPVAMYFGFLHRDRYWAYRTAYDRSWYRFSPGAQLVAGLVADLHAAGVHAFDLMRGAYPYKLAYPVRPAHNIHAELGAP